MYLILRTRSFYSANVCILKFKKHFIQCCRRYAQTVLSHSLAIWMHAAGWKSRAAGLAKLIPRQVRLLYYSPGGNGREHELFDNITRFVIPRADCRVVRDTRHLTEEPKCIACEHKSALALVTKFYGEQYVRETPASVRRSVYCINAAYYYSACIAAAAATCSAPASSAAAPAA